MANIGVVLVNYKKSEEILQMAATYASYSNISSIVIVNNSKVTKDFAISCQMSDKIYVIDNKENAGYSKANNQGMRYLKDKGIDYYLISNSDVKVSMKTIELLLDKLIKHPDFGILAPAMCDSDGNRAQLRYLPLGLKRAFLRIFRGVDDNSRAHLKSEDNIYEQSFVPGSLFLASARAMESCGYFDENVFLYREEEILGQRMARCGYKVGVVDNLRYKHLHDMSTLSRDAYIRMYKQEFASERYFFKEYLGATTKELVLLTCLQLIYGVSRVWHYTHAKKNFKISIIVPTLDCPKKVATTIASVVSQKYDNWELIVQDATKTSSVYDSISSYLDDKRIRYINEADDGIYDAMNRAVKTSTGDYLLFLGAGDYLLDDNVLLDINEQLEDVPDILRAKVQTSCGGEIVCMDRPLGTYYTYRFEPVCHQSIVAARGLFAQKIFDTRYEAVADQDWLMYMVKEKKQVDKLDRAIVFYEEEGFSSDKANVDKARADLVKIHQKYFPLRWAIVDALREAKRFYIG